MTYLKDADVGVAGEELEIVLRDLDDRSLANTGSLTTMMSEQGAKGSWVTPLGRQLLEFVLAFE